MLFGGVKPPSNINFSDRMRQNQGDGKSNLEICGFELAEGKRHLNQLCLVGQTLPNTKYQIPTEIPNQIPNTNTGWCFGTFFIFPHVGNNDHPN